MYELSCNCGHVTKGNDRYMVEGEMWVHAIKDHKDLLAGMSAAQLAEWLKNKDKTLAAGR